VVHKPSLDNHPFPNLTAASASFARTVYFARVLMMLLWGRSESQLDRMFHMHILSSTPPTRSQFAIAKTDTHALAITDHHWQNGYGRSYQQCASQIASILLPMFSALIPLKTFKSPLLQSKW
jgi:hypothetical protein